MLLLEHPSAGEQVPHMCSFLLMTIFPQMFFIIYLGFLQEHCFPFDSVIGWIHIIFMVSQPDLAVPMSNRKLVIRVKEMQPTGYTCIYRR